MTNDTRVFFVVDSIEDNEELFETLEEARAFFTILAKKDHPRIRICIVRNAYRDNGTWTYEDLSDTFEDVQDLATCNRCGKRMYGSIRVHHHTEGSKDVTGA